MGVKSYQEPWATGREPVAFFIHSGKGDARKEENASYIWIEKRPGVFESIMVETGVETNGMIEIKSE